MLYIKKNNLQSGVRSPIEPPLINDHKSDIEALNMASHDNLSSLLLNEASFPEPAHDVTTLI